MHTALSPFKVQGSMLEVQSSPSSPDAAVLAACHAAATAEGGYVQKAVLAGIYLLEYRATLTGKTELAGSEILDGVPRWHGFA